MVNEYIVEYHKRLKDKKRKIERAFSIITIVFVFLIILFFMLNMYSLITIMLFNITLAISMLLIITTFLISQFYVSEKPLFNYLYPKIIEQLNIELNSSIKYDSYIKGNDYIKNGGLFTKMSSAVTRYRLSYTNEKGYQIQIYDSYLYTQADKSRVVHLDGIYFIIKIHNNQIFQLRSKGSPKLPKHKFRNLKSRKGLKDYVLTNSSDYIYSKYYNLFDYLKEHNQNSNIYISGVDSEFHIGIDKIKLIRKVPHLTQSEYDNIKQHILDKINLVNDIIKMIE